MLSVNIWIHVFLALKLERTAPLTLWPAKPTEMKVQFGFVDTLISFAVCIADARVCVHCTNTTFDWSGLYVCWNCRCCRCWEVSSIHSGGVVVSQWECEYCLFICWVCFFCSLPPSLANIDLISQRPTPIRLIAVHPHRSLAYWVFQHETNFSFILLGNIHGRPTTSHRHKSIHHIHTWIFDQSFNCFELVCRASMAQRWTTVNNGEANANKCNQINSFWLRIDKMNGII